MLMPTSGTAIEDLQLPALLLKDSAEEELSTGAPDELSLDELSIDELSLDELSLDELAECSEALGWADVCKDWQGNA